MPPKLSKSWKNTSFWTLQKNFMIDPTRLHGHKGPLIEGSILKILEKKEISLKLSLFDSDPNNTAKPVMVLIHSNSGSKKLFDDHINRFSKDYRIIAIDLLGHGDSTKISDLENISLKDKHSLCEAFYNPLAMIAEVVCLLESLNIEHAHSIGWSLGGHIAYGVAITNPKLVASIASIGSPPVKFSHDGFKKGFSDWFVNCLIPEWINHPKHYSLEEGREMGAIIGFLDQEDIESFTHDIAIADSQMRRHLFLKLDVYDSETYHASSLDAEQFIYEAEIPLCLIVGEKDAGINANYIASLESKMRHPLSATHVIEGAAHATFKTHADEYYQILDRFIDQSTHLKAAMRK